MSELPSRRFASARGLVIDTEPLRRDPDFRRMWAGQSINVIGSQITRVIDYARAVSLNLGNAKDAITNVDLAIETGKFTSAQVILSSAQSTLASANGFVQTLLSFLQ